MHRRVASQLYSIVFRGEIQPDWGMADVRRNLSRLLRMEAAAVYRLFSGHPVALKRGVDASEARRFATAMVRAGAIVRMEPVPAKPGNAGIPVERRQAERRAEAERRRRPRHSCFFSDRRHIGNRRADDLD